MGKYDSLIDEEVGAKPAPTTPQEANYGALIDEELSSAPLHNSLFSTAGTNPDEEAKKRKLAKELNTPAAILPNDAEQQVQLKKLDADVIKTTTPATAKFLTNEDNAKVTGLGGVDKLVQMEQAYKTYNPANIKKYIENYTSTGKPAAEAVQRLSEMKKQGVDLTKELDPFARSTEDYFKDPIKAAAGGANIMAAGLVEISRLTPNPVSALMSALSPEYAKARRAEFDTVQQQLNDNVEYWQGRKSPAMQALIEKFNKAGVADSVMMLMANPSLAVDQLSQSTPYMVPGMAAARGGAAGMASFNAFIEASDAANTARQEAIKNGQSLEQQDKSAMAAALVTAPLAFLGNKLTGTAAFEADFFTKGSTGQKLLEAVVKEAISGAIEEGSNQFGTNVAASMYDDNRQLLEGVGKAMVIGGLLESTHAVGMTAAERALNTFVKDTENVTKLVAESNDTAAKAVAAHDTIEQLSLMTADNDLRTRAPEAFQEFIETMTEDMDLQEVYVDGATALAAIQDNYTDIMREQPELFARVQEAAGLGHDVQLSVGEYLTNFAGKPIEQAILPALKSEAGGATYQEAQEFYNKQAELFQSEVEAVAEQNEPVMSREEFVAAKGAESQAGTVSGQPPSTEGQPTETVQLPATYEEYVAQHKNKREVYARDVTTVEDTLYNQFAEAKRFTPSVNRAYVSPLLEFYKTQAKRMGMMPSELYNRYPLKIQSVLNLVPGVELMQQRNATISDFKPENVGDLLTTDNWVIMSPENPNKQSTPEQNPGLMAKFIAQLEAEGIEYLPVDGQYGSPEKSVILFNTTPEQGLALGRQWNQESVLTKDGLIYQDGSREVATGITVHKSAPEDYFTTVTLPDGTSATFTVDIDFSQRVPAGQMAPINPELVGSLDQTKTEAFKKWFGDSKVVDENGEPLVVYHGTTADFDVFDTDVPRGMIGKGAYFASNPATANSFASKVESSRVVPVYLSLQNPYISTKGYDIPLDWEEQGYDGAIWIKERDNDIWYAVKNAESIKSAIGNVGTFDANDPNILNQSGKVGQVSIRGVHYSKAQRDTLSGGYYGTGIKGAEGDRLRQAKDSRIRQRLYFYVNEGKGVFPEYGVGNFKHEVDLPNMYDGARNPLKLPTRNADGERDMNVFESAVIDAGFDGYYIEGAFGRQGAAVLLGDASRSVKPLSEAEVYQSTFYSALTRGVAAVKQGKGNAAQWKGIIKNLPGVKPEEIEAVGVYEWLDLQEGSVTKEALVEYLDRNGVQVEDVTYGVPEQLQGLPEGWSSFEHFDGTWTVEDDMGNVRGSGNSEEEAIASAEPSNIYGVQVSDTLYEKYIAPGAYEGYREHLLRLPYIPSDVKKAYQVIGFAPKGSFNTREEAQAYIDYQMQVIAGLPAQIERLKAEEKLDETTEKTFVDYMRRQEEQARLSPLRIHEYEVEDREAPNKNFRTSHWQGVSNIVAHVRTTERRGVKGERVLFIEEIQSDWGQQGKKEGFVRRYKLEDVMPIPVGDSGGRQHDLFWYFNVPGNELQIPKSRYATQEGALAYVLSKNAGGTIPTAPFVQSTDAWVSLAIKRMMQYAADNGFDQIAVTNGDQAVDNFDLSKQVEFIRVIKLKGDKDYYSVEVETIDGDREVHNALRPDEVENLIGKDMAAEGIKRAEAHREAEIEYYNALRITDGSISEQEYDAMREVMDELRYQTKIEAEDLRTGGEGMRVFYDKIVPKVLNNVLKKLGGSARRGFYTDRPPLRNTDEESARYREAQEAVKESLEGLDQSGYTNYTDMEKVDALLRRVDEARSGAYTNKTIGSMASEELTQRLDAAERQIQEVVRPAVKNLMVAQTVLREALDAPPVYGDDANLVVTMTPELVEKIKAGLPLFQGTRGSFNLESLTMTLMQGSDLSTVIHESGHFYLEMLEKLANVANAPQEVQDDYAKTMEWFGVTPAQWSQMTLEQKRPFHEQWAESFELWNLEGKAPTQQLQPVFSRFRAWLLSVYKSVEEFLRQNPGAGRLNDEVRGVFSRLLASAEAIEATEQARAYQPLFASAEQAGVSQNAYEDYLNLGRQATQDATDALQARSLRDMKWLTNARNKALKALQDTAKATRAKVLTEVAEQVTSEPIYQAMRFLRTGETKAPNGDDIKITQGYKLDKAILAEMYPESALDRPDLTKLRGMTTEQGLDPDVVARMFGLPSGDALVREIVTAENMRDKIQGLTDQRMLEEHGDLVDEKSIQRAADEAVHNEARAKFMATGLKMLSNSPISVTQMVKAAKQAAENVIANKRVRDVKPKQYTAAESRANKDVLKLAAKNPAQAAEKQRVALLNNRLAAAAQDAVTEVEKALRYLGKFNNEGTRKNLDLDYLEQIDALLEPFDLRKGLSLRTIDARTTLAEWVQNQEAMGFEPTIDPVAIAESKQKSYKNMTMSEVRALVDTIKQIEHMGRMKKKLLTAIEKAEFAERIAEAKASIAMNANRVVPEVGTPSDAIGQLGQWVRQMFASHRKFTSFMRELDGGKNNGVLFNLLVRPMAVAGNTETEMKAQAAERLATLFQPIMKKISTLGNLYARRRVVPGTNISMTHEQRIMFAMNWGNEGNRQRLLDGGITGKKAMSEAEARAVLDTLTKEEWDFVQGVWDYIAEYRPLIAEQERTLTGKTPEWVEPAEVVTKFGTYRGGYFPAKYDTVLSTRSDALEAVADLRSAMKGAFGSAAARNGYTKARAAQVVGRPLLLNFNAVSRHVNEVIHRLAWQAWLIDAGRVARALDNDFRTNLGAEATKEIQDAIRDIAQGDAPATGPFEVFLNRIRTGTSIVGMGWKISTAMLQPTGLSQSAARVGGRHMTRALARYIASPLDSSDWVNEKSVLMRNRGRTMNREMNEILNTVREGKKVSAVTGSFFYLIGKLQRTVDVPTFIGAYEKSLEDQQYESAASEAERKRIEATAIAVAEQTVIDTQGGGELKDLAKVQRGSPIYKLFTNFYSYMSTVYNLNVENYRTKNLLNPSELGIFAAEALLINFVPVVMAVALKNLVKGSCDWDDMECLAERYTSEQISHLFGQMVGLREIGVSVDALTGGEAFGYTGPAGLRFFVDVYKSAEQINQGEADMALFKAVNNTLGALFHYPAGQINATVDGAIAIENGEVEGAAILPALIAGAPK